LVADPDFKRFSLNKLLADHDYLHLYTYVGNDPTDKSDPTGTSCTTAADKSGVHATSCKIDVDRDKLVEKYGEANVAKIETGYLNAVNNLLSQGSSASTQIRIDTVDSNGKPTGDTATATVRAAAVADTLINRNVGYAPSDTRVMASNGVNNNMVIGSGIQQILTGKQFSNPATWHMNFDREMMKAWTHEGMHTEDIHSQLGPVQTWVPNHSLPYQQAADRLLSEE
jgi:hypothetical protein